MGGRSPGGAGCFSLSSSSVVLLIGTGSSSEQRIRAAALILPSSNFADTAAAIVCSRLSPPFLPGSELSHGVNSIGVSTGTFAKNSLARVLILEVRLWRLPPLMGWASVRAPKDSKCCQWVEESGSFAMRPIMVVRSSPRLCLAAFGICLISLVWR
jgi:hypothetical protein